MEVKFRVRRYKQGDIRPHFEEFTVDCDTSTTVLVALQTVRREDDPSLMLRHSCHHVSCGTCGMKINGQEKLACDVRVLDLDGDEVRVEPLDSLPVLGDLVVDMTPLYEKCNVPARPYLRASEFNRKSQPPAGIDQFTRFENCVECGLCVSACPVMASDECYLGPAAMAAAWRVIEEPRGENGNQVLDWVDQEHGCWRCHLAFECSEVCPTGVDPGAAIMSLRKEVTRRKLTSLFRGKRANQG